MSWQAKLRDEVKELREGFDWSDSLVRNVDGGHFPVDGPTRRLDALCLIVLSLLEHLETEQGESKQ